jgi:trimethylamine--corrinoid protein Co-methyltransferase
MASLEILEEVGINVFEERALKTLDDAGAEVNYQTKHVNVPQHIIQEAIGKAPKRITLYGRDPTESSYRLEVEDRKVYPTLTSGATSVIDLETGQVRKPVLKDIADIARLQDALGWPTVGTGMMPTDVRPSIWSLYGFEALLNNSEKHCWHICPENGEVAKDVFKMGAAAVGGEEELKRKPIFTSSAMVTSPLIYSKGIAEVLVDYAKWGIPITVGGMPLAGATGPVTLAGTLALQNSEFLAGLVIAELVNPGTPVFYEQAGTIMDMRAATVSLGCPELGIVAAASAQMARYYGVPSDVNAGWTDSKTCDIQAGYEKAESALIAAMAGANVLMGWGMVENALTCSFDATVIDIEIISTVARIIRGVDVSDETLAVDVIKEIGPGGNFLRHKHTRDFLTKEHFIPEFSDRFKRETWEKKGRKDAMKLAHEKAMQILKTHCPKPLEKDVKDHLRKVIKEAEKREGNAKSDF